MPAPADQFRHLRADLATSVNGRWWRWLSVPWQAGALSIIGYRLSRAAWLGLGRPYQVIHTLLAPVQLLLRPFGAGLEIHYKADIGPGLQVLHPNLGVVVSGHAVIGRALVLTGGNCIGSRPGTAGGDLTIGDGVTLGANAVILGPASVGHRVVVGAGSVLIGDAADGATMVGSPARPTAEVGPATP